MTPTVRTTRPTRRARAIAGAFMVLTMPALILGCSSFRQSTPSATPAETPLAAAEAEGETTVASLAPRRAGGDSAIRILVNDEPITTYDIQQRTQMVNVFSNGRQGESAATNQLIDETLMLQEARRLRMVATEAEVDAEFASRARDAGLTTAQFNQAVRQAGFDPETFRDFLRANISWADIIRARFRATVSVTEQDVAAALVGREETAEQRASVEYLLRQIVFVVPDGAGSGVEAQQRREATAFRDAFQGCDQALEQAGGRSGVVVRPPIRREAAQLPDDLRTKLASLDVGGVTAPDRVPEGIQILAVCARNEITGQTETDVEVRQEISSERGQLLARRYLRDLRSDAVIEYR